MLFFWLRKPDNIWGQLMTAKYLRNNQDIMQVTKTKMSL